MLLLLWKVPIRLLSGPFSACKAGSEAFLEMGTTEGKVPQSSLREERNLAESFGSHKNQLRLTNIRGPIKKYSKTAKFVFFGKSQQNSLQIQWDTKKLAITTKNAYLDPMWL